MTEALNFTGKAAADFMQLAEYPTFEDGDRKALRNLAGILDRAAVFVLPDAGELVDRSKPRPEVPGLFYRPPFPVVALEYRALDRGTRHPVYEVSSYPKRIALAWEHGDDAVAIASLGFSPVIQRWMPMVAAMVIPFDCRYAEAEPSPHLSAFLESGRLKAKQMVGPKLQARGYLPMLPDCLTRLTVQVGMETALSMAAADLMDEVNAYIDLCLALACTNVTAERVQQPARLNRARIKAGKPPLKDFHLLKIGGGDGSGIGSPSGHGGMRAHLRRGHIRRLAPDRVTWVNSCMVRGSRPGFAGKQYEIAGAQ